MSIQAKKKGEQTDELKRLKDKSRKTQSFLSQSKKVQSTIKDATEGDANKTQMMLSGGSTQSHTAL